MRSKIILTFNRNGMLGERAGFSYVITDINNNESVVSWTGFNSSTKNMWGQVGISGMSPVQGYGQASRHFLSLMQDMPSFFMVSGADNIVEIEVEYDPNLVKYSFMDHPQNHDHVDIQVFNFLPDHNEGLSTSLSVVSGDCDVYNIRVQSNIEVDRYTLIGVQDEVIVSPPSSDFTISLNRGVNYNIEFGSGVLFNQNSFTLPKMTELDFIVKKLNSTDCEIIIDNNNISYLLLTYSFDGGETFSNNPIGQIGTEGTYDVVIQDRFGCLIGRTGSFGISIENIILSRSPHYLNLVDFIANIETARNINLYLYFWYGDYIDDKPSVANIRLRAENIQGNYLIDVSPYIYDFLEPKLDETWTSIYPLTADTTQISADTIDFTADRTWSANYLNEGYDEACWVYYEIEYIQEVDNVDVIQIYESYPSGGIHLATRGYGYFNEGYNPVVYSTLEEPSDKYSTNQIPLYWTDVNYLATHTDDLISRRVINDNKIICNNNTNRFFEIIYLNKAGVFCSFIFSRSVKRKVKNDVSKYNFTHKNPYFDKYKATTRQRIKTTTESYVASTTIQDERNNKFMEELISSEQHYMIDRSLPYHSQKPSPIVLTSYEFEEKTSLNNRARIEWTIEFDLANNKINRI